MKFYSPLIIFVTFFISSSAQSQDTVKTSDPDSLVFARVEKESEFPGGLEGWRTFLVNNLKYPRKALKNNIQGTVVVQFIVDLDGSLKYYEAISGPELLRGAAVDVLKKSPKWIPAEQDGKVVKSYKKQPITFKF